MVHWMQRSLSCPGLGSMTKQHQATLYKHTISYTYSSSELYTEVSHILPPKSFQSYSFSTQLLSEDEVKTVQHWMAQYLCYYFNWFSFSFLFLPGSQPPPTPPPQTQKFWSCTQTCCALASIFINSWVCAPSSGNMLLQWLSSSFQLVCHQVLPAALSPRHQSPLGVCRH